MPYPVQNDPDPKDITYIEDQIIAFNYDATGWRDGDLLSIILRGEDGQIQAGIYGWTWGVSCEIRFLWVHEKLRRQGIGRELLASAEAEASRRGCRKVVLTTHSFQAPEFYKKYGYVVAGFVDDYPLGYQSILLSKTITPSA